MQKKRWQQIEEIFNRAAVLPAAERRKFIEDLCRADEDLCREVLALVEADDEDAGFLDEPVFSLGARLLDARDALEENAEFASYRIRKLLGKGGMGAVYLARDTRLERLVALKILPPALIENAESVARFRQEARAASAISHPNVAHIYEFGEEKNRYFLAMEYVEGKTLRELLKENLIDFESAADIARQIAEALAATHKRGVIHRDIKPENVIISESGLVKVLDFGLAKLDAPTAETSLVSLETTPGMIIGTTAYMSPEQVRGQALDARTDLWSLGVVLFEMLAGERPFTGATASDVQAAILLKDAPVSDLPTDIALIVGKLLKKDVGARYQTAADFLSDLHRLKSETGRNEPIPGGASFAGDLPEDDFSKRGKRGKFLKFLAPSAIFVAAVFSMIYFNVAGRFFAPSAKPAPPQKIAVAENRIESIAVLPFRVDGTDEELKLLSQGLAEDLTRSLGSLKTVRVTSYASARRISDTDGLAETGARLNAKSLLRGRLEYTGNEISVSVELFNASDGAVLWSERLNAAADDLLKLRNALTQIIVNQFQKISGVKFLRLALTDYGTRSNEAFRAYLEGKYGGNQSNSEGRQRAAKNLERAVALDPQYALAHAALADAYNLLGTWYGVKPDYYQPLAEKTLEKALAIDPNLAEARTTLAKIKMDFHRDWTAAEREFQKAIELNPNYALAHHWYGEVYLSAMGRYDEALRELELARQLNPLSSGILTALAWTHLGKKDYQKAIEICDEAAALNPSDDSAHSYKAMALMKLGRFAEAIETAQKASSGNEPVELGVIYALSGRAAEAREILRRLEKSPDASPYDFAVIYGALGEKKRAFALLEKQLETNSVDLLSIRPDPLLDSLRDDARFAVIEGKLNLPTIN
jgi:serine/threonine protein kinase/Tfp pilus assembly protein PilF